MHCGILLQRWMRGNNVLAAGAAVASNGVNPATHDTNLVDRGLTEVRIRLPSSRASLRIRLSPVDVTLAAAAPLFALYFRNVDMVTDGKWAVVGSYFLVSVVASLLAFQFFRISEMIPRYLSVRDLLDLAKVVLSGQLVTTIVLFTFTRLDGIPRSVPAIQALILGTGLVAYRVAENFTEKRRRQSDRPRDAVSQNVILIGLNDWSVLVMKFLKAHFPERWRVVALLDEETRWFSRSVNGVQVFGPPAQLETIIEEFATHGVGIDRVAVGGGADGPSEEALAEIKCICARRNLELVSFPDLSAICYAKGAGRLALRNSDAASSSCVVRDIRLSPYFRLKRLIDAVAAAFLILWLLPLLAMAALLVIIDVGSPVLFWQQRVGKGGGELQILKLRTLRPPFDRRGQKIPEEQRLSWIGRLLRQTRIDELPQLLNVLVGDMSLIGPRPLLPEDQPPNSVVRLTVCPGITGWAQVNGGARLSPTEKDALDVWYIYNASLWLDLRIVWMTFVCFLNGERRSQKALFQARIIQAGADERSDKEAVISGFSSFVDPSGDDAREAVPVQSD